MTHGQRTYREHRLFISVRSTRRHRHILLRPVMIAALRRNKCLFIETYVVGTGDGGRAMCVWSSSSWSSSTFIGIGLASWRTKLVVTWVTRRLHICMAISKKRERGHCSLCHRRGEDRARWDSRQSFFCFWASVILVQVCQSRFWRRRSTVYLEKKTTSFDAWIALFYQWVKMTSSLFSTVWISIFTGVFNRAERISSV